MRNDRGTPTEPPVREVSLGRREYPRLLTKIPDAPDPLYVRGALDPQLPAVAIVGSRACTRYGRQVTERLASELAVAGVAIVSGLARGIDAAAHRATVGAGGRTVAVLPGGLDRPYPPRHRALARSILRRGAWVSEQPFGSQVRAWSFPQRNRIIAGLAHVVVVVEAAERSGARITAGLALDYGREVLVVPGPVTSPVSRGCHGLLTEGAHPCTGSDDVLALLPPDALARLEPLARARVDTGPEPPLDPGERRLLEALALERRLGVDVLQARTRMPLATLLAAITRLELRGWVQVRGDLVDLIRSSATDTH